MKRTPVTTWLVVLCIVLMLGACGGGGSSSASTGGSSTPPPIPPASVILTGQVMAPNGNIAFNSQSNGVLACLFNSLIATAHAELSGLTAIHNGTTVELGRIGSDGIITQTIATTTIEGGSYRFDLTSLGVTVSSGLIVRVANIAAGAELRAFVTDERIDIDPASETVMRIVLEKIAANQDTPLSNFTLAEIEDLTRSLELLSSGINYQASPDIESVVLSLQNIVSGNVEVSNFINAIVQPGQSGVGPGDLGDYFPFTQGISWTYAITETEDGIPSTPYSNTVTVDGNHIINNASTTVFSESNPNGDSVPDNSYYQKTSGGVFDWTPVIDGTLPTPFRTVRFPATPGTSIEQSLGDLGLNTDIDEDGIVEQFQFTAITSVVRLESVSVPAGAFQNSLKILTTATANTLISSTGENLNVTVTVAEWYTKNLGLSKQVLTYRGSYGGQVWTDTRTQELTETSGFPFTQDFPLDHWISLDIESYDIICDSVSGKLFASVPSNAANYANTVVVIDPVNAQIEAAIPVDSNPGPLTVSDNGQFLYVGLNGSPASILQIAIPTLTTGPEWTLSDNLGPRYPHYIDVQPGSPEVLAVTTTSIPNAVVHAANFRGAVILDRGIERPNSISWDLNEAPWQRFGPIAIEFSDDPTVAYGYNWYSDFNDLLVLSVDSNGITIAETKPDFYNYWSNGFKHQNGELYTSNGYVYEPSTGLLGVYPSEYDDYRQTAPDSAHARVAITQFNYNGIMLEVFAMNSYTKQSELRIPATNYEKTQELESCGNSGYAMRVSNGDVFSHNPPMRLVLTKFAHPN